MRTLKRNGEAIMSKEPIHFTLKRERLTRYVGQEMWEHVYKTTYFCGEAEEYSLSDYKISNVTCKRCLKMIKATKETSDFIDSMKG